MIQIPQRLARIVLGSTRNGVEKLYSSLHSPEVAKVGGTSETLSHTPVMLHEVLSLLDLKPGQTILDMTCGGGGHTEKILQAHNDIKVFGLDRDPIAIQQLKQLELKYPKRFVPMLGRFSESVALLRERKVYSVDAVLFDLGCSSMQFDDASRGFSVSKNGPLDMRMDGDRLCDHPTAAQFLQYVEEEDLVKILKVYGEEKQAKKIARAIVESRYMLKSLKSTHELCSIVSSALSNFRGRKDLLGRHTNPATKTFQAIRIFLNDEINELNRGLEIAYHILKPQGTLIALSFHSLEDRIVKRHLVGIDMDEPFSKTISQKYRNAASWHSKEDMDKLHNKKWRVVNKHVLTPTEEEIGTNPRCRSAKLRCAKKMANTEQLVLD